MSGFFSLGTGIGIGINKEDEDHHHNHHHQQPHHGGGGENSSPPNNNSLYLFKNEEIYSKGFELWQQCYQLHQRVVTTSQNQTQSQHHFQHHQQQLQDHHDSILLGVGPSRRSFTLGNSDTYDHQNNNNNNNNENDTTKVMMRQAAGFGIGGGGGGGGGGGSGGGMNCQDCGNQAKKDCIHMRCRTCCKSRGFHCQTHVKSTWVPAAKRRERQQQLASLTQAQQQNQQQQQSLQNQQLSLMMRGGGGSRDQNVPKRLREDHLSLPTQHHSTGLELGNFPAEVSSPAVFRCVRLSAIGDADEQFAYQTAVNIAGHTFKGILYDKGPEGRYNPGGGGESSSGGGGGGSHQQPPQALHLITSSAAAAAATGVATNYNPALTFIDPSSMYPAPLNSFMAGTQFFPPPRP